MLRPCLVAFVLASAALTPQRASDAIVGAYARVEREQASSPAPATDRERLERLLKRDQAGRTANQQLDWSGLSEAQRLAAHKVVWAIINAHDRQDQAELKGLIPASGWFPVSVYGAKAEEAAFLVVQHAVNDPQLMRTTLAALDALRRSGEAAGPQYALMYDRVALELDHQPQRYGSQVWCRDGRWQVHDLEDPARVDERRKAVGLQETEAQYVADFADMPCR